MVHRPTDIPAFYLVEWLKLWSDLAEECMACDEMWTDCLTCGVTEFEREMVDWLRY